MSGKAVVALINRLKETVDNIVIYMNAGDRPATMREIARFTVLFDEYLRRQPILLALFFSSSV